MSLYLTEGTGHGRPKEIHYTALHLSVPVESSLQPIASRGERETSRGGMQNYTWLSNTMLTSAAPSFFWLFLSVTSTGTDHFFLQQDLSASILFILTWCMYCIRRLHHRAKIICSYYCMSINWWHKLFTLSSQIVFWSSFFCFSCFPTSSLFTAVHQHVFINRSCLPGLGADMEISGPES